MKVGFIGLGNMGCPMAKNLCRAGYEVFVNDINKVAVTELTGMGASQVATAAELSAQVDFLVMMLPNEAIVREVVTGKNGVLTGAAEGLSIIDMSSVSPEFSQAMASLAQKQSVSYIDAPVSGGVKGAEKGSLTIMAGGEEENLKKCRPILETLGKKIYEVGSVGAGDAVKMINNMLLAVNMAAVAEAFVLGGKIGIDPVKMLEVVRESSGNSYALQAKMTDFVLARNFSPGFTVDLQQKDLELAVQSAKKNNIPLFMGTIAQQLYSHAQAAGFGKEDISAVIKPIESNASVCVQIKK